RPPRPIARSKRARPPARRSSFREDGEGSPHRGRRTPRLPGPGAIASAAHRGLDLARLLGDAGGEHLAARFGDEDVVLDADPADVGMASEDVAAEIVAERADVARIV